MWCWCVTLCCLHTNTHRISDVLRVRAGDAGSKARTGRDLGGVRIAGRHPSSLVPVWPSPGHLGEEAKAEQACANTAQEQSLRQQPLSLVGASFVQQLIGNSSALPTRSGPSRVRIRRNRTPTRSHKHTHTHKARAHVSWQLTWSGCAGIISATRDRAPVDKPRGSASLMPLRLSPVLPSTCSLPVHFPHFPLLSSTPTRPLRRVWTHRRIKCESNAYRHT